jgi:hypothetical protein
MQNNPKVKINTGLPNNFTLTENQIVGRDSIPDKWGISIVKFWRQILVPGKETRPTENKFLIQWCDMPSMVNVISR